MNEIVLTFFVSVMAGILTGVSGGGGGLITAPFFILIGISPQIAVATTKFGAVGITMGSIAKFRKTESIQWKYVWKFVMISVLSSIIGVQILLAINNEIIEKIIGLIILVVLPFLFFNKTGLVKKTTSKLKKIFGYLFYFIISTLQAAFGSGVGMPIIFIYSWFFGFTMLESSATRRIPGFILSFTSLVVYTLSGVVLFSYGISMFAGMLIGGYLGTHIAIKKGNGFVKIIFSLILVILGIKLLI